MLITFIEFQVLRLLKEKAREWVKLKKLFLEKQAQAQAYQGARENRIQF